MRLTALDHIVLTVADIEVACAFYAGVLGMERRTFAGGRTALHFGAQKINLHLAAAPIAPHATRPTPGSADLCFVCKTPVDEIAETLRNNGIAVIEGPVARTGAQGPIRSVYCADPDGNLIELSNPA